MSYISERPFSDNTLVFILPVMAMRDKYYNEVELQRVLRDRAGHSKPHKRVGFCLLIIDFVGCGVPHKAPSTLLHHALMFLDSCPFRSWCDLAVTDPEACEFLQTHDSLKGNYCIEAFL